MIRKLLITAGAVLVLLGVCFLLLLRDGPPPDVTDLRLVPRAVAPEANGYPFLVIEKAAGEGDADVEEGKGPSLLGEEERGAADPFRQEWDPAAARGLVEREAKALDRLEKALGLPDLLIPARLGEDEPPPPIDPAGLSILLAARAVLRFDGGDEAAALGDARNLLRLGRALERSQGGVRFFLIGQYSKNRGLRAVLRFLPRSKLPAGEFGRLLGDLDGFPSDRAAWADALKADYPAAADGCDRFGKDPRFPALAKQVGGPLGGFRFKPNSTKRMFAERIRAHLEDRPWREEFALSMGYDPGVSWVNSYGKDLVTWSEASKCAVARAAVEIRFLLDSVRTALAIARFREARGALPASLEELVPDHLPGVPRDPWDDRPLRYSREKAILWSVGYDGKDEGGSRRPIPEEDSSEPTVRLASP